MSGMKAAQEAPPLGHPLDGRFGRVHSDTVLIRQRARTASSCNPARQSVAQSGAVRYARKQDPWIGRIIGWNAGCDKGGDWVEAGRDGKSVPSSIVSNQASFHAPRNHLYNRHHGRFALRNASTNLASESGYRASQRLISSARNVGNVAHLPIRSPLLSIENIVPFESKKYPTRSV